MISLSVAQFGPYNTTYSGVGSDRNTIPPFTYTVTASHYGNLNGNNLAGYTTTSSVTTGGWNYDFNKITSYGTNGLTDIRIFFTDAEYADLDAAITLKDIGPVSYTTSSERFTYTVNPPKAITTTQGLVSTYNIFVDNYNIVRRTLSRTNFLSTARFSFTDNGGAIGVWSLNLLSSVTSQLNAEPITYTYSKSSSMTEVSQFTDGKAALSINGDSISSTSLSTGNFYTYRTVSDSISNNVLSTFENVSSTARSTLTKSTDVGTYVYGGAYIPGNRAYTSSSYVLDTVNSVLKNVYFSYNGTSRTTYATEKYDYTALTLNTSLYSTLSETNNTSYYLKLERKYTPFISEIVHTTYDTYTSVTTSTTVSTSLNLRQSNLFIDNHYYPAYALVNNITDYNITVYTAYNASMSYVNSVIGGYSSEMYSTAVTGDVSSSSVSTRNQPYETNTYIYSTISVTYSWGWTDIDSTVTASTYFYSTSTVFMTETLSTVDSYEITSRSFSNNTKRFIGYSTSYTGSIRGPNVYGDTWLYIADVETYTEAWGIGKTRSTVEYRGSSFGIYGTSVVSQTRLISSSVDTFITSSMLSESTVSSIESQTTSSLDVPFKFYTTHYASLTYSSVSSFETNFSIEWSPRGVMSISNVTMNFTSTYSDSNIEYGESSTSVADYDAYGTTYRLSTMISSENSVSVSGTSGIVQYNYSYSVQSMWSFNDTLISTISEYTTVLRTSFTTEPSYSYNSTSYNITASNSIAVRSSDERFDYRVEISRTSTSEMQVSNTVMVDDNNNPLITLSSSSRTQYVSSTQSAVTTSQTFKSSTADLSVMNSVVNDSYTTEVTRGNFKYSSMSLLSSTFEQQNETLIFASTFNSSSYYNNTTTYSTINTVAETVSATTYSDWYNPTSWTESHTEQITSSTAADSVKVSSGSVSVTQTVGYTPTYDDIDGVYVTA